MLIGVGVVVVLALAGTVTTTVMAVRRPLPTHSGRLSLPGLDGEVTVLRDARGVPTITAVSAHDLFLAQGYTDAQDRFFLMDYRRHAASGTLSALVGAQDAALAGDTMVRTLGWRQVAEQEWDLLSPTTRQYLTAYADGVNAYLSGRSPGEIAVEYTVQGLHRDVPAPARWTPVDSLVWLKAMAWDLHGDDDAELARVQALQVLGDPAAVAALFPAYPAGTNAPIVAPSTASPDATPDTEPEATPDATTEVVSGTWSVPDVRRALGNAGDALAAVPHLLGAGDGIGSNSWAVSGEHTVSGRPLLAADLHTAVTQPGVWSQVGLRCAQVSAQCPFDVSGFSVAGFPGVMIGHNGDLAWALTDMGADVSDLFVERVVGDQVQVDGARQPLTVRQETIEVAGGDPVTITVRSTSHGPIVSGALGASTDAGAQSGTSDQVALGWAALTPGVTADAIFALDAASDADEVAAAAASFQAPAMNVVFATTDGHIGYQAAGRIPVRGSVVGADPPTDGTWPRLGWDSAYDWQGWVDPAALPHVLDPAEGFVVAANQQVGGDLDLPGDWDYGYRAQRIRELLTQAVADGLVDTADMQRIALDKHSPAADVLVPALLDLDLGNSWDADGQDLLRTWDRQMDADSPAATYFATVWKIVLAQTFSDELPAAVDLTGDSRSVELIRQIIDDPQSRWWDDSATKRVVENRDEVLSQALVKARAELTAQLGSNPKTWTWGTLHRVAPAHPVLGDASWPVRWLVDGDSTAVGGGSASVDATSWQSTCDETTGRRTGVHNCFTITSAPSLRMVVDLADLDSSTWVNLTGTSGHPASSHYDDQTAAWAAGKYYPWPSSPDAVQAAAKQTLRLVP